MGSGSQTRSEINLTGLEMIKRNDPRFIHAILKRPEKTGCEFATKISRKSAKENWNKATFYSTTDLTDRVRLTLALAHGKNIPRQNRPRIGPPTIPKIFKATWSPNVTVSANLARKCRSLLKAVNVPAEPNHP